MEVLESGLMIEQPCLRSRTSVCDRFEPNLSFTVQDPNKATITDLGTHFFLRKYGVSQGRNRYQHTLVCTDLATTKMSLRWWTQMVKNKRLISSITKENRGVVTVLANKIHGSESALDTDAFYKYTVTRRAVLSPETLFVFI